MRMRFEDGDERAFYARRDELGEQFAVWLHAQGVPGDPNDAGLLMDWKWSYGDGELDRWTVADVHGFLFEWCVRKLSASPADCAEIPLSIAAFVEFLAHTGLLGPGDPPARIRKHCEQNVAKFVREMGNPANFGMAKSLFAPTGTDLDLDEDDAEMPVVGPVRMPSEADRLASVRAAPVLAAMRELARFCAAPGRPLTAKGNLRVADARLLVDLLDTGDAVPDGLRSADDLPELGRAIDTAVRAGVVRRVKGRLVAVARFAGLDDVQAHAKIVTAALGAGDAPMTGFFSAFAPMIRFLDDCVFVLLFKLLDRPVAEDELTGLVAEVFATEFPGLSELFAHSIPDRVRDQVRHLVRLGVVVADVPLALTPAGVPVVAELARSSGFEVLVQPDPATADARAMVDLIGLVDQDAWDRDITEWFNARADPEAAAAKLVAAVTEEHQDAVTVLAGLEALARLAGERAVELVRPHLDGPHDGLVLNWLVTRGAIDPATVDPARVVSGLIDFIAAALDGGGPTEVVAIFSEGPQEQHLNLLDTIWRIDHPRLAEVLDTLGKHHPVKVVAKAARKALVRHRSRPAHQASRSR
jgi:hypothetical protein